MDSLDKEVRYVHTDDGLREEIYENANHILCVADSESDDQVIIIHHDDERVNTVIEGVDWLCSVKDIKTV